MLGGRSGAAVTMDERENRQHETRAGDLIVPYSSYASSRRLGRNSYPGSSSAEQPRTVDQPALIQEGVQIQVRPEPVRIVDFSRTVTISDKPTSSASSDVTSADLVQRLRMATSPNTSSRTPGTPRPLFLSPGTKSRSSDLVDRLVKATSSGSSTAVVQQPRLQSTTFVKPNPPVASSSTTLQRDNVNAPQKSVRFTLGSPERSSQLPKVKEPAPRPAEPQQTLPVVDPSISSDFLEPEVIPKTKPPIYVYPHSGSKISDASHERFREVVDMFRHNTESHVLLTSCVQHIDYTLRMCGVSAEQAHPSILVFCRTQDFAPLRALLTSRELGAQYLRRKSPNAGDFFGRWRQNRNEAAAAALQYGKPLFNLYFWRSIRPRTLLGPGQDTFPLPSPIFGGSGEAAIIYPHNSYFEDKKKAQILHAMSGATIRIAKYQATSTLGCVIAVGDEYYGVTTRHSLGIKPAVTVPKGSATAFGAISKSKSSQVVSRVSANYDGSPRGYDEADDDYDFEIDDVEYESMSDDYRDPEEAKSTAVPSRSDNASAKTRRSGDPFRKLKPMKPNVYVPKQALLVDGQTFDGDWALVHLNASGKPGPWEQARQKYDDPLKRLANVPLSLPKDPTHVLIVTDEEYPQNGVLQPDSSILGGINGDTKSIVWTVKLSGHNSLTKGDSGAVVVDTENGTIYGLVVGSNPLGEVYISPFDRIWRQIRCSFPESTLVQPRRVIFPDMRNDNMFIQTKRFCAMRRSLESTLTAAATSGSATGRRSLLRRRNADSERERSRQPPDPYNILTMSPYPQATPGWGMVGDSTFNPFQPGTYGSYPYAPYPPYPPGTMMPPPSSGPYPMAVHQVYQQAPEASRTSTSVLYSNQMNPITYGAVPLPPTPPPVAMNLGQMASADVPESVRGTAQRYLDVGRRLSQSSFAQTAYSTSETAVHTPSTIVRDKKFSRTTYER